MKGSEAERGFGENENGKGKAIYFVLTILVEWYTWNILKVTMKMSKQLVGQTILMLCCMVIASSVHADGVYKWVDGNGHAHYTIKKPNTGEEVQLHVQPEPSVQEHRTESTVLDNDQLQEVRSRQARNDLAKRDEAARSALQQRKKWKLSKNTVNQCWLRQKRL